MSTILNIQHTSGSLAGKNQRIAIQEGQTLRLGRDQDNDIKFSDTQDDSVSGHHAELSLRGGRLSVEDKKSSNGTFVDGAPCPPFQKIEVLAGATLRLAKAGPEMKVTVETVPTVAAAPAATVAPPKESVGRATLLSEIDRARKEERQVVAGEIAATKKSTGLWVSLGLILVLLFAAGGIGGAAWLNHRKQAQAKVELDAKLALQDKEKAALEAKLVQQQDAINADKGRWAEIEKSSQAVVLIHSRYSLNLVDPEGVKCNDLGSTDYGSGVLIQPGVILTALHVIEPWKFWLNGWKEDGKPAYNPLEVQYKGQQPINATVIAGSREYDLALLQVQATNAQPVSLGSTNDDIKVTDNIAVIGYPGEVSHYQFKVLNRSSFGERVPTVETVVPAFLRGTVSQSLKITGTGGLTADFLYFNPAVALRTSGGPIFNAKGELIGIVSQEFTG